METMKLYNSDLTASASKLPGSDQYYDVFNAAVTVLVEGLKDLKILKGSTENLIKQKAYKPYFPHGIGHSLGLDVHDVGGHRENNEAYLLQGMVFTVEPGLYFPKAISKVPALGVRIEDDVLVTKTGCRNLSALLPKERKDIEALSK